MTSLLACMVHPGGRNVFAVDSLIHASHDLFGLSCMR